MAPQSLTEAVLALRRVVATAWKLGYILTTSAIIFLKFAGSSFEMCSSRPGTSKPSAAVKSSSLPIMTSTSEAILRFTSTARAVPPCDFHNDGRKFRS